MEFKVTCLLLLFFVIGSRCAPDNFKLHFGGKSHAEGGLHGAGKTGLGGGDGKLGIHGSLSGGADGDVGASGYGRAYYAKEDGTGLGYDVGLGGNAAGGVEGSVGGKGDADVDGLSSLGAGGGGGGSFDPYGHATVDGHIHKYTSEELKILGRESVTRFGAKSKKTYGNKYGYRK